MITVERAQKHNGERIRQIAESSRVFNKTEVDCVEELWEDFLNRGSESEYQFMIGQIGDQITGFVCFGQHTLTEGAYDIYWIAVDPQFQKLGTGAAMIQKVENEIKQRGGNLLVVETSSTPPYRPARTFYRHNGLTLEATIHDFYSAGDHLMIYTKPINNKSAIYEDRLLQQA